MTIDFLHFTPWPAFAGGVLIGLAAAILILVNGRIVGISGILGGLLRPNKGDITWRLAFIAGIIMAAVIYSMFYALPETQVDASWVMLIVAGLLVGIGTRYASGCTSGHGVCGISRRSPRSIATTMIFMAAGFIISGMANPAKVLNFLDLAGNWDPSLAFVMAVAILIGFFAFFMLRIVKLRCLARN
ncbi:YeeE/YedE family protein [Duganella sp. SAP-35]|uniref:YeeE/YedE family protein n=1 Tax=Duganella aceris TaxID=2703883 RepID=A0ABX0FGZ7_9BURK|nr:YeeE/YedE family protein [Duganella aceris]